MKKLRLFTKAFPMAGRIFYSPEYSTFFQVKAMNWGNAECGGFCRFYSDAQTTICRQALSYDFIAGCLLVSHIDTFVYAEPYEIMPGCVAWRALAKAEGRAK